MRSATSLIPAEAPIVRPVYYEKLDYEVELRTIIGPGGRHIKSANALGHVFGDTLFNDASMRDFRRRTAQWTPGKNFDARGPTGPTVVTPHELPTGALELQLDARLNGQVRQAATTPDMLFKIPYTLEMLCEYCTLEAGNIIAMGAPEGVGHARKPAVRMKPEDLVEVEIEGVGICHRPVFAEVL